MDDLTPEEVERFWSKVARRGDQDCWFWTAARDRNDYGRFALRRKPIQAHRVSVKIDNRDPSGFIVMHTCHNPPCVNPAHLKLGTHTENMRDRDVRGRHARLSGQHHGRTKLTGDQIFEVLVLLAEGVLSQEEIAKQYGISRAAVKNIKCGGGWSSFGC